MKNLLMMVIAVAYGFLLFPPGAWAGKNPSAGNGAPPTFNREVVNILQSNCQVCHHPGDIAPFSLMTYAEAAPRAQAIKRATERRIMPPWKPADGCGELQDVRRLSDKDIDILARWADAGAPEGDDDPPPPLEFPDGWTLGEPDVALDPGADYSPNPLLTDDYHCFTMPTNFTEDRWLSAVDIRPGVRSQVHHVLLFVDPTGRSADLEKYPGSGYTCFGGPEVPVIDILGGWAPGARSRFLPEGIGQFVPAGSRIIMQVHYHPQGPIQPDRTRLGAYLAQGPVDKRFYMLPILDQSFLIPAGNPRYRVNRQLRLPADLHGLSAAPHMHLLGKEMEVKAILPDGQEQCLINIDDWDFNWQGNYFFANSVAFPLGTKLDVTAYYDNSEGNPRNPSRPPIDVRWGERTVDEMFLAFLGITIDGEKLGDARWKKSPELEDLLKPVNAMGAPMGIHQNENGDHSSHH
ncbi:MAG: hypothetical protein HYR55_14560 [Acidobacteria bacterium]|nr:hypothetical protein [Acidobacteriota bacterium]MBI3657953.1 hypothetical protein [Acidobacteriota bacterium]